MLHYPKTRADWLALRVPVVTSTEMAALFDESPYLTKFELWHQKKAAEVVELDPNERMTWGTRLQDAIARGFAEDHGLKIRALSAFATADGCRIGASFDYEIVGTTPSSPFATMYAEHGPGNLEIKNIDGMVYRQQWQDDEAPAHIEIQVQTQLEAIDRNWSLIGALVGGNRLVQLTRLRDREVGRGLRKAADLFWSSIDANAPPTPDFARDADLLRQIYRHAEPGQLLDARGNDTIRSLCEKRAAAAAAESAAKDEKDACTAELLTMIGTAEKVLVDGFNFSAGVVAETLVPAYVKKSYRNIRITTKREKSK